MKETILCSRVISEESKAGAKSPIYYAGDWDAQMEDAKEEIAAFVRARKAAAKQPR
jgi:hypothetical protein